MINILIQNKTKIKIDRKWIRKLIKNILKIIGCKDAELSLLFVDDDEIRELNLKYRGLDKPTDVLSFSMKEGEFGNINPSMLGDIVISLERANKQADEHNITFEYEIANLITHGILHLLGFEHANKEEAELMNRKKEEILEKLEEIFLSTP